MPYENNTNDPELDLLGSMTADWIIEGLINFESIQLVSYQNTQDHDAYASVGNWEAFAKETGAEKIIRGSFYQQDSVLIFKSQVIDVETGNIEFVLPEIGNQGVEKSMFSLKEMKLVPTLLSCSKHSNVTRRFREKRSSL